MGLPGFVAAPLGLIPCPTLSAAIGLALVDVGLLVGAAALAVSVVRMTTPAYLERARAAQ